MASACLPWLFQAVEIDGVPYWDGGFTGNPALWPLFENCASDDVVLVQINPIKRPGAPTDRARHHQPRQRDHIQRFAAARPALGRFRLAPDRSRAA
jgi:predicted acylesterase/phospholipase RssA